MGCSSITSITIPGNVKSIGKSAFEGTGLTSVTIGSGVESIGESAFFGISGITSITIPGNVKSIGKSAFEGTGITSITIPGNVKSIGKSAFQWTGLTSVTIGSGVESIGDYAFYGCGGLTSITIPDSVTNIGNSVFEGCSNVTIYGNDIAKRYAEDNGISYVLLVSDISLNNEVIFVGDTGTLNAEVTPLDATNKTLAWNSSDENIITINQDGNYEAIGEGTATITASATDGSGVYAECVVTVTRAEDPEDPDGNNDPEDPEDPDGNDDPEDPEDPDGNDDPEDPDDNEDPNGEGDSETPAKPEVKENTTAKLNGEMTRLILDAAKSNVPTTIFFKDYDGSDCINLDTLKLLESNPNVTLVFDYTFYDVDTASYIHVNFKVNKTILNRIVRDDIKEYGPACLSGFVQYQYLL